MNSIRIRTQPLVAVFSGMMLALSAPVFAQGSAAQSNADMLQRRSALIEQYRAASDRAERDRIVEELGKLRAKESEQESSRPQPNSSQAARRVGPSASSSRAPSRPASNLPSPSGVVRGAVTGAAAGAVAGGRGVGLGSQANATSPPDRPLIKEAGSETKVAEKNLLGTDEEGNNRFERSGGRVISRDGIEAPPETPAATDEEKSRARRLAESTEIGVTFLEEKVGGELKKFETESASDFRKRRDLAKGRSEVRFGAVDASVTGDVKFNPGKLDLGAGFTGKAGVSGIKGSSEGQLGNDNFAAKGSASGSVLKAEAKLDTRIGATKKFVGAKIEAGAGASVAEGSLSGSIGSRWLGIEIGGSVSGSVLTAEARGKASAGFNRETRRFEIEIGGKIGALLAGAGANIKISLNKPGWWPW